MKCTRANLERHVAVPAPFDAFFSFPVTKGGYSGVGVFTNSDVVVPLKAAEGLSGRIQPKPPLAPEERISPAYPLAHHIDLVPDDDKETVALIRKARARRRRGLRAPGRRR